MDRAQELYIEWLNSFDVTAGYEIKPEDFEGPYGWWELKATISQTNGVIEIFSISTGDEGGPQTLFVFRRVEDDGIDFILQAFDTMYAVVYSRDPDNNLSDHLPHGEHSVRVDTKDLPT